MKEFVEEQRLEMEFETLAPGGRKPFEVIHASSTDASMVMLGMKHPDPEESEADYLNYYRNVIRATEGLPVVMVLSAEEMDFGEIIGVG
ncbi:MAG: hypothetical protein JJU29_13545 [Verrucomicrobia bacterium]|nr:hypothetical protein [Verrucomicrobiota bacterium]MCH8513813.1 hypothetical protein [Kiritimatiellia bacterium]